MIEKGSNSLRQVIVWGTDEASGHIKALQEQLNSTRSKIIEQANILAEVKRTEQRGGEYKHEDFHIPQRTF